MVLASNDGKGLKAVSRFADEAALQPCETEGFALDSGQDGDVMPR